MPAADSAPRATKFPLVKRTVRIISNGPFFVAAVGCEASVPVQVTRSIHDMKRSLLFFLILPALLMAQDQRPTGGLPGGARSVTPTRTVTKYTALESNLFQALQESNRQGAENILAPDFESWSAEKIPPMPRGEWLQAYVGNLKSFNIRNMAVREFGDVAVVSFLLVRSGTLSGKAMSPVLFIVDVWRQNGDKLAVRYASAPANPAGVESRPTGKE